MREICVSYEQANRDYPTIITQMLSELNLNKENKVKLEDINFFYYWTVIKVDDVMENHKHLLLFNERLNYELGKIAIEIYIKVGTYIRGEIVDELDKPKEVIDQLKTMLYSSMKYEQMVYKNQDVINSLPTDIVPDIEIERLLFPKNPLSLPESNIVYTLDDLLDKICKLGYDGLTDTEKEILDNLSKA